MHLCPSNKLEKTSGPFAGRVDTQAERIALDNDFYNYTFQMFLERICMLKITRKGSSNAQIPLRRDSERVGQG